ncbi:hypothetical protein FN846DRAFT_907893 [Sphaerosporella brunnea]|uniref:Uncharacterized protein n=1 Tax=Sphaerosporella brunnea TaxID=1250544 RepID=A0A5J5EUM5_9PEZI|nr:hypothetical protein FN846DRAFT_907893 [Sphaerosporella brunnea]
MATLTQLLTARQAATAAEPPPLLASPQLELENSLRSNASKDASAPARANVEDESSGQLNESEDDATTRYNINKALGINPLDRKVVQARRKEVTEFLLTQYGIQLNKSYSHWRKKTWTASQVQSTLANASSENSAATQRDIISLTPAPSAEPTFSTASQVQSASANAGRENSAETQRDIISPTLGPSMDDAPFALAPLSEKTTRRGTNKAASKNPKKVPTKAGSKKAAQKPSTDPAIIPTINGSGLLDSSQVAALVTCAKTGPVSKESEGGCRVLRSRKGLDNAY